MKALGIHVFAGGFTMGVMKRAQVTAQMEIHNFGRETCESLGVPFINETRWEDWLQHKYAWQGVDFTYGNPRCTGFSSLTSGYDEKIHGPCATCTQDIWDLSRASIAMDVPLIIWESVQQAFTTGRPLIDRLRDEAFVPAGYRIAHLMINAATHGNCQRRKRYFFVAYRGDKNFNCAVPDLGHATSVRNVIGKWTDKTVHENSGMGKKDAVYKANDFGGLGAWEKGCLPFLAPGVSMNGLPWDDNIELQKAMPRGYERWTTRCSGLPFSLHCPYRLIWDKYCPTISSASRALIHPDHDRTLTMRELSALMGWPKGVIPIGPNPVGQIAKGICPEVGEWLAGQVQLYLDDAWGADDWSSRYCHRRRAWVGEDHGLSKPTEKIINMTHYDPWLHLKEIA